MGEEFSPVPGQVRVVRKVVPLNVQDRVQTGLVHDPERATRGLENLAEDFIDVLMRRHALGRDDKCLTLDSGPQAVKDDDGAFLAADVGRSGLRL